MDYINGKAFFAELTIYHAQYVLSVREETEKPEMLNAIAHAIIQICTRLSNSFNFIGYTYKDEMISDAIVKCFAKVHRFDPSISENAFAFFTQCAYNAFINRIKIEQKQSSVKARIIREKMSSEFVAHGVDSDADDGSNAFVEFLKENDSFVDYIDQRKQKTQTGVPDSLKHRNKTAYSKKEAIEQEFLEEFDLSMFEEA